MWCTCARVQQLEEQVKEIARLTQQAISEASERIETLEQTVEALQKEIKTLRKRTP